MGDIAPRETEPLLDRTQPGVVVRSQVALRGLRAEELLARPLERFGPQQALKTPRLSPQAAEPAFPRVPATALLDRFGGGQGTVAGGRVR